VFARSAATGAPAVDELVAEARREKRGWFRAKLVRCTAGRARALPGLLAHPDDLCYLSLSELSEFAAHSEKHWAATVAERREAYARELRRRQVPRVLHSDGRALYDGIGRDDRDESVMTCSPVSPGIATGDVRVVLDPGRSGLLPGEILVCRGTDPSWTPLFLTASGLVMEVGGLMTDGAVVAREYGIPAVVGLDRATERLQAGQRVSVNGSTGEIRIVAGTDPSTPSESTGL
jgi:pyruvate,water dikinase